MTLEGQLANVATARCCGLATYVQPQHARTTKPIELAAIKASDWEEALTMLNVGPLLAIEPFIYIVPVKLGMAVGKEHNTNACKKKGRTIKWGMNKVS